MGNSDSIDFSLSNLYRSWYAFRRGKRASSEIIGFQYSLESNIDQLHHLLVNKAYKHGAYAQFIVQDSKRREIAVAPVRDRVVHRLIYDHLVQTWDKTFIFDAWSCRNDKGQHRAIERAAKFMERLVGTLKDELPPLRQLKDLGELSEAIALTIHYYNHRRIHTALHMSPAAYAASLNPAVLVKTRCPEKW